VPVTVVVGGQYGSEGKGKIAYELARQRQTDIVVRVGGSNSGHTAIDDNGRTWIFRHLPTGVLHPNTTCVLPAGSYIDPDVLETEIANLSLEEDRLVIDPNAAIITSRERQAEKRGGLREQIGSTLSGTGAAVSARIARTGDVLLASDLESLSKYVKPVRLLMRRALNRGARILIEGTQGFGLSVLHSQHYPHVTSRDTTAAAFVSESGLSPRDVDSVVMVIRAFPIRVPGNSGPLPNEIDWATVTRDSQSPTGLTERTTVTGGIRRVARFHPEIVLDAIAVNRPTHVALNHVDYVDASCDGKRAVSEKADAFVRAVEKQIGVSIDFVGLGPSITLNRPDVTSGALAI
jgi:adenylosuccinate synthase